MSQTTLFNDYCIADQRKMNDYFCTPDWALILFFDKFLKDLPKNIKILDPCAGGDNSNNMPYPEMLKKYGYHNIKTNDIRPDSKADLHLDYFENDFSGYDLIISNPPFSKCIEFVKKSLLEINEGGTVVYLLPFNMFGGVERGKFYNKNLPSECYLYSKRVFTCCREVAHFVFKKENPNFTKLYLL